MEQPHPGQLCAKLRFLCSSRRQSLPTLSKGSGAHGLCLSPWSLPQRVTGSSRRSALSMTPVKRCRCGVSCQFKFHLLLQTPFVWNIAEFWTWVSYSYLNVTMRTRLISFQRRNPYRHSFTAISSTTLNFVGYILQSRFCLWYRQLL